MMVVRVEIWPGGDPRLMYEIGLMTIVNTTPGAVGEATYEVMVDVEPPSFEVKHVRADGAWALVKKALQRRPGAGKRRKRER